MNQEEERNQQAQEFIPENNIELSMLYTNPVWGSDREINKSFRDKTTKTINFVNQETGQIVQTTTDKLWEQLQFFTRDLRLGNLSSTEVRYCDYYLRFASDCLKEKYIDAFIVALSRVASTIELSQSKGGFLRKRLNTQTKEIKESMDLNKKNGLFHGKSNVGY